MHGIQLDPVGGGFNPAARKARQAPFACTQSVRCKLRIRADASRSEWNARMLEDALKELDVRIPCKNKSGGTGTTAGDHAGTRCTCPGQVC